MISFTWLFARHTALTFSLWNNLNTLKYSPRVKKDILAEININNSLNFSKENNSKIYSFLDSFTQDDLFQPLDAKHQKKSSYN